MWINEILKSSSSQLLRSKHILIKPNKYLILLKLSLILLIIKLTILNNQRKLPDSCPSCNETLAVTSLGCSHCGTTVSGNFQLPILARLAVDEQKFITEFVKSSGSLKIMAQQLGLSYPTVRNLLDDIITKLQTNENSQ